MAVKCRVFRLQLDRIVASALPLFVANRVSKQVRTNMDGSVSRYRAFGILLVLGAVLTLIATWDLQKEPK